jgi:hypothetical protein
MEARIQLPEMPGLKFALVAGLTLLATDMLFAQSAIGFSQQPRSDVTI